MTLRNTFKFLMFFVLFSSSVYAEGIFQDLEGKNISLSDYQGKWIVVNYWAHWCGACFQEIPELNAFSAAHPDTLVLGVNYDKVPMPDLASMAKQMNIKFTVLQSDPGMELGIREVPVLPATFVINPQGKIVASLWGEQTKRRLESAIKKAAKKGNLL